ncbi:MAG: response regulator transcription factor [Chloroflexi bacterium]|nr:response regulator transcription factor [Chloroflexota bacterium]MBI3733375.1 response regulator transcription factor [Chloroflexota bacterium]
MRILLVDDHAVVRRGLEMVLRLETDFDVVGDAANGEEAVAQAKRLRPDLILMDLKMPRLDGASATREIKRILPDTRVLMLTGVDAANEIMDALEAGADGYVLKEVSPDELIHAIRVIGTGEAYLEPVVTRQLLSRMRAGAHKHELSTPKGEQLTPREREVLQLMVTSATHKQMAERLSVSEETVRSHTKNVLAKLHQPNRTQAVLYALREGLVELG